jgi:glucokinase
MSDSPRLIADIGGTYARFALEVGAQGASSHAALSLRCAEHADFHAAVAPTWHPAGARRPQHAAVAIANPVEGDQVRMTNYHWQFSIEQMRQRLGLDTLVVVNDFTALAMASRACAGTNCARSAAAARASAACRAAGRRHAAWACRA